MGSDASGLICYGLILDEGVETPWYHDDEDGFEDWWSYTVPNWKPAKEIWNASGTHYLDGVTDEDKAAYYEERYAQMKKRQQECPVELLHYGHYDFYEESQILAVRGTEIQSGGWEAQYFDILHTPKDLSGFWAFVEEYLPEEYMSRTPGWILSARYG